MTQQIGAWGISLGGGAAWNSVVAGVPFMALETFETWSDLYRALFPQNFGKAGAIYNFAQSVPADRIDPALRPFVPQMIGNENLPAVRTLLGTRSSLSALSAVTTPSFLFQGRRDFAFDIDQATDAYRRLAGPKRLYVGDFGHSPVDLPRTGSRPRARSLDAVVRPLPEGNSERGRQGEARAGRVRSLERKDG